MKRVLILLLLLTLLVVPARAMEFTAPEVPSQAQKYMPDSTETFAEGLWQVIKAAVAEFQPALAEAASVCLSLIAIVLMVTVVQNMSESAQKPVQLAAACMIGVVLLRSADSLIRLGIETVTTLTEYGKLLLPVMTAATAAQGNVTTSAALYTGTTVFITVLTTVLTRLIVPMLYIYLALSVAGSAVGNGLVSNLQKFLKWLMTWILKLSIYIFTGYIGITKVISGSADASAIKATKLAMSGFVPVVGSIMSDASEAVLASAGIMKSAAGVYGILAMAAIVAGPFVQVGAHYLMLKLTAGICAVFGSGNCVTLLQSFTGAMGMILGTVAAVSVMLLVSTVCFMKGVS